MPLARVALALFVLIAGNALAQNNRSAVSINGSDLDPCTVASPCRSFTTAIAHTNPSGEIIALDSAGYGPFTIPFEVSVSGAPGVHAAITTVGGDGIAISAGILDNIRIRNLVLISTNAGNGIHEISANQVDVSGCQIRNFNRGILVDNGNATVEHSGLYNNSVGLLANNGGVGFTQFTVTDCILEESSTGVVAGQQTKVAVSHCTLARNNTGVEAFSIAGTGSLEASLTVSGSTIVHNVAGVLTHADGGNNTAPVYLSDNVIAYNGIGAFAQNNGVLFTFGNNTFAENDNPNSVMTPLALQ